MNGAFAIGAKISLTSYAVFALVACGGSDGNGSADPGGTTYPVYSVGGMVFGLAGSGLVLSNTPDADSLALSASGSFTFARKIGTGSDYDVVVYPQPSNPSQVCVVANGSGTMGSGNVTDVSVVCTTGVANANLKAVYKMVGYSYAPLQSTAAPAITAIYSR